MLILAVFVAFMNGGAIYKKPWSAADDVADADRLEDAWDRVMRRIQFVAERDEISSLSVNLARLKGAIAAQDSQRVGRTERGPRALEQPRELANPLDAAGYFSPCPAPRFTQ